MHTYVFQKGTTNVSIELEIIDSSDGTPETGVVFNTAGIDLQYRRDGAASTAITEATLAALTTAHTDGGFLHIGNGVYRFDLPDAACASGVDKVVVHGTVTGMVVIPCVIQLVDYDPFDAVRMGMTALPNAAADAAGGLPISDAGGLDLDSRLDAAITSRLAPTVAGRTLDITTGGAAGIDWGNVENPTTAVDLSATDIQLVDTVTTYTGNTVQTGDAFARLGAPAGASVSADVAAIKAETATILVDTAVIGALGAGLTDITDRLPAALTKGTADSGTTTTLVDAALTQADDDWFKGQWIRFTSTTLDGQMALITGFTASSDTITFTPAVTTAVVTHTYEILPSSAVPIDWGQVLRATSAVDLSATDVQLCDTVTTLTGHTAQTGDSFARLGAPAGADVSADIAAVKVDTAATLVDTAEIGTAGAGLTDLGGMSTAMKAEVLVEVNAALDTAIAELGVGAPAATPTLRTGLMLLYMALRNRLDVDTTGTDALKLYNDAGTQIASKAITDDGTDYSEAEMS